MKKYFSIALIAVVGLFAWSCSDDNVVAVYNPDSVTPQTLGDVTGVTLAPDGDPITIPFSAVDFGLDVPASYTLYVAKAGTNFDPQQKVPATIDASAATITVKQPDLNTALLNLGASADADFQAEFRLVANALTDKNAAVGVTETLSAVKAATFRVYEATLLDKDVYEIVYVQGDYAGWNFDNCQYLYNYSKDGHTFSGVVDLADKAANGIKVTGTNDWGDATGNWGFDDDSGEQTAEAGSLQLKNGSNTNVTAYSKRFYNFSFDKNSLVLTKQWSADAISIIGAFNGWADEGEIDMQYNPDYVRFYADVDFAEATEFKFRVDHGWDLNWGADCVAGGPNIACEAGQYRIYLDLNKNEIKIDANMYGKDEPRAAVEPEPEPEPETYKGWGIIGSFNAWGGDAAMTEADGVWTGFVTLEADAEWKLRKDAAWTENVGGVFVALGEPFEAVAGGDNIKIGQAGFFKVVYDTAAGTITISDGNVWSLIGTLNGSNWDTDYFCTLTEGKWVSPEFTIEEGQEFKFRFNMGWDVNYGGTFVALGEAFEAVAGGDNIKLPAGRYVATLDAEAKTITVVNATKTWGVIGDFNSWGADEVMTEVAPGIWVSDMLTLAGGWKVRFDGGWDVNYGGTTPAQVGQFVQAVPGGDNVGLEGTFKVVLNTNNGTLGTLGWGLVGSIASLGFGWGEDLPMNLGADGKWYSIPVALTPDDAFKIRKNAGWDENYGGIFAAAEEPFAVEPNGGNIAVTAEGTYMVVFDPATTTITLTKSYWGAVGDFNSWGADDYMLCGGDGKWYSFNRAYAGGWKLRQAADWAVNVGGTFVETGSAFEVTQDGPNINVGDVTGFGIVYDTAANTITVTTDKVL